LAFVFSCLYSLLSLASYFNVRELNYSWLWIGSFTVLVIFGVATLVEIFAYYISFVDNLLDSVAVPLAAFLGTAVMVSTVVNLSPEITWTLAIIAGGGTAAAILGASGATLLASTATTAGIGNPVVATIETGTALVISIVTIFLPIVGFVFVLIIGFIIFIIFKKIKRTGS
jgi:hypothetical protein